MPFKLFFYIFTSQQKKVYPSKIKLQEFEIQNLTWEFIYNYHKLENIRLLLLHMPNKNLVKISQYFPRKISVKTVEVNGRLLKKIIRLVRSKFLLEIPIICTEDKLGLGTKNKKNLWNGSKISALLPLMNIRNLSGVDCLEVLDASLRESSISQDLIAFWTVSSSDQYHVMRAFIGGIFFNSW